VKSAKITFNILLLILVAQTGCNKNNDKPEPDIIEDQSCLVSGTIETFDIISFNIQQFPKEGPETIDRTAEIILDMDADLIALQEITSETELNKLLVLLDGWSGLWYPVSNGLWNLAYIYKDSEISIDNTKTKVIYENDSWSFPRPPFEIHVSHIPTGINTVVINNHFKCCGGDENENRRRSAADKLYEYIGANYEDIPVIVIGDLNDDIVENDDLDNVFLTFINDSSNYRFADIDIAKGSHYGWSYPSYPSHIDHILVSNELFSNIDTTLVYRPNKCISNYSELISDHRPVCLRLK